MRASSRTTIAFILCATLGAGSALAAGGTKGKGKGAPAAAADKKKAAAKPQPPKPAPKADTRAVGDLMGKFKWGMSAEDVEGILFKTIDEKYDPMVHATTDVYKQDQFRKKSDEEKKRIKDSLVKFDGNKGSWDVSLIGKEFDQKNEESMLVYWENDPQSHKDQRRFFFFVDGKLWKMFIAFNAEMFQGKKFADFQTIMETRYGKGALQMADGKQSEFDFVFWRSEGYYLRAIDQTEFFGSFGLAISDDNVEQTIYARRDERNPKTGPDRKITDSVTDEKKQGPAKAPMDDPNSDVIDRMTGTPTTPKK